MARLELSERLAASLDRGSVILVADAGFGKTTALEQAPAHRGGPADDGRDRSVSRRVRLSR